jgi:manganese/zinc/iron transport system substrate-binding protein
LATTIIVLGMLGTGCGGGEPPEAGDDRLKIVATTTIVGDLVRAIGGDDVQVDVLMGPGIDPHLYKASAGDVRAMSSADAIIYNGLFLEGKLSEVLEELGERGVTTVAVAECVDPAKLVAHADYDGLADPHVWFDVSLWTEAAECLGTALAELDPARAGGFEERARTYREELAVLDEWVRSTVAELPADRRILVTAHDAFSYFAKAYDFEVRGLLGVSTASEAGTADVQALAEFIVERRVPAVFVESSVSPRFVEALQEAVAARGFEVVIGGTLYSDSLGDPSSEAATYLGTVRSNVQTIVGALTAE